MVEILAVGGDADFVLDHSRATSAVGDLEAVLRTYESHRKSEHMDELSLRQKMWMDCVLACGSRQFEYWMVKLTFWRQRASEAVIPGSMRLQMSFMDCRCRIDSIIGVLTATLGSTS